MGARFPLSYSFAKAHQLLLESDAEGLTLWVCPATVWSAVSEVQRHHDGVRLHSLEGAELGQRIAKAYAGGDGDAAAVVGEVESAVDLSRLMQDLPAVIGRASCRERVCNDV